jgi:hypothetical protein
MMPKFIAQIVKQRTINEISLVRFDAENEERAKETAAEIGNLVESGQLRLAHTDHSESKTLVSILTQDHFAMSAGVFLLDMTDQTCLRCGSHIAPGREGFRSYEGPNSPEPDYFCKACSVEPDTIP